MNSALQRIAGKARLGKQLTEKDAAVLLSTGREKPFEVIAVAAELREQYKGRSISLCAIVNAKSGTCAEDCRFCAQSAHYFTDAPVYPLLSAGEITARAQEAAADGAHMFGIVTSGTEISTDEEWQSLAEAIRGVREAGLLPCGSLGMIDRERARFLKEAGLFRYHHNLETSRSFFPNICTTHRYEEDLETNRAAKAAGLSTCAGGIIGLGESIEQRIELAFTLRDLDVDSVPLNFLNPIEGTPLADAPPLPAMEILLTIALFRFILPTKDIKLCGGKERNLRQLLPLGIVAGANSLMTGNYLTTTGRNSALDLEMIRDLGLTPSYCAP